MSVSIRLANIMVRGSYLQRSRRGFLFDRVLNMWVMPLLRINVPLLQLILILSERHNMYDGGNDLDEDVIQEVRENSHDQQNPPRVISSRARFDTQPIPEIGLAPVMGLSRRQNELIMNNDVGQPQTGAARERRLQVIDRDIAAINRFLPRMKEVRAFLATMPIEDDEALAEAKQMSDLKLAVFIAEIASMLASLEEELELKRPTG